MNSNERIVSILVRLFKGEALSSEELVNEYTINKRTLQRDISTIKKVFQHYEMNTDVKYHQDFKQYSLGANDETFFTGILMLLKIIIGTRSLTKDELQYVNTRLLSFLTEAEKKRMKTLITSGTANYLPVSHGQKLIPLVQQFIFFIENKETIDFDYVNSIDGSKKEGSGLPINIYFADFYFYILMYSEKYQCCYSYRLDRFSNVRKSKTKRIKLDYKKKLEDGVLRNKTYLLSGGKETTYTFRY
jgi:proteasome accessory factor C